MNKFRIVKFSYYLKPKILAYLTYFNIFTPYCIIILGQNCKQIFYNFPSNFSFINSCTSNIA